LKFKSGIKILHILNIKIPGHVGKEPFRNCYEHSNNLLPTFKTMKYLILILFLIGGVFTVQSQEKKQSLKDLLFSGKLKKDSTGVIRSTDDLSQKIDTTTKKEVPTVNSTAPTAPVNNNVQQGNTAVNPSTAITTTATATGIDAAAIKADTAAAVPITTTSAPAKSNTKLLKEYTDSLVRTLQEGPLKAKQIKKDTYYVMLDYEIDTNGQVNFTNVTSTPESSLLQAQVKQILDSTPLRLNPVTDSNNQGKKVKRKQQFTVTKE